MSDEVEASAQPTAAAAAAPRASRLQRAVAIARGPGGARVLDLLGIAVVSWLALTAWPLTVLPPGLDLPAAPWWGGPSDRLLEGPDAAQWAENAQRMADGAYAQLDPHRMPSWLLAVAAVVRTGTGVVVAGHMVNRVMFLGAALGMFALGRAVAGRAAGVMAACMLLAHPHMVLNTQRFGIDASIEAMLPLAMAASLAAGRRWALALPLGLFVGWTVFLHHTTLPYVLPALMLTLLAGEPGWRRWAAALGLWGGSALVVAGLSRIHPLPGVDELAQVIIEGAHPGSTATGGAPPSTAVMLHGIGAKVIAALPLAIKNLRFQLWNPQIPNAAFPALFWLGVTAPLLRTRAGPAEQPVGLGRELLFNTAVGVVLLSCLAPLPVLTAVGAPARYGSNLTGFGAVLLARGALAAISAPERGVRRFLPGWPEGLLGAVVAGVFAWRAAGMPKHTPPLDDGVIGLYVLSNALQETFPPGAGVECPPTEAVLQAGLKSCGTRHCPVGSDEGSIRACLHAIAVTCPSEGFVGYVALPGREMYDPNSPGRPAMDAWVAAHFQPAKSVTYGRFSADVYKLPVDQLP